MTAGPRLSFPAPLIARAKKVRLIAMDVDGVLTGGEIIVLDRGGEIKIWSVKDRMGFHLVRRSGAPIKLAWITGRRSRQVAARARECRIDHVHQDCMLKLPVFSRMLKAERLRPEQAAYIGDDLIDVPVLRAAGLSVCPQDAPAEVRAAVHYVSRIPGGKGVVREVIELVLKSQGLWDAATRDYR